MLIFWILVFIISLALLVKSADWLLESAERIGLSIGMSPFLIGVTIIAVGTSFPELISSLFAIFRGVPEIVVANAIGSNIANMLLVVGISVLVARSFSVSKDLIDLDLPLLALSTALFYMVARDGSINIIESIILLFAYISYVIFSIIYKEIGFIDEENPPKTIRKIDYAMLVVGVIGLSIGANYLIESVIILSELFNIAPAVISITAVAIGTSLPELLVSVKAALKGKSEVALGNIFGSNVFNLLGVVGIPGLFATLPLDVKTLTIGVPVLLVATGLFVISGISRKIHMQEGIFYLAIYGIFMAQLFELF